MSDPIGILLVEDNKILGKSLASYLNNRSDLTINNTLCHRKEIEKYLAEESLDIVLLDIHLPDSNGIEICQFITTEYPHIKVLMLSHDTSQALVQQSVQAGAMGYVSKDAFMEELILAVKSVANGNRFFSSAISSQILASIQKTNFQKVGSQKDKKSKLTTREKEIMLYVYKEYTNEEIAEKLFISPRTVDTHKRNIMKKLKLKNSVAMVKYYIENLHKSSTFN